MKFIEWLRPGIKFKRWIFLGSFGVLLISFGFLEFVNKKWYSNSYYQAYFIFLAISGSFIIYISVIQGMRSMITLFNKGYISVSLDSKKLENLIYEKRLLVKGPKIVVIGGGTGLSTMLRGLKHYTSNITAIVTVGDDGGGSGDLREDLGILPPGDIRNCILALADTEPLMEELLQYRFTEGKLKNQNFGNLFLAAMDGISGTFEEAVRKMSSVLAVTGKVLPVTLDDMVLYAKLENGSIVQGESSIPEEVVRQNSPIDRIFLKPENASALREAVLAIKEADSVILGPGSLFTSIIPNVLVKDIGYALKKTTALKIYVSNIMTQKGETDGYSVSRHIKAINKHIGQNVIDAVIVNVGNISEEIQEKYKVKTSNLVSIDERAIKSMGIEIIEEDLLNREGSLVRHNSEKLASVIIKTIMEKKLFYDRKKIIEYFYLSGRLKENKNNREK